MPDVVKKVASLLVVDDEEHIRLAIAEALELEGFRVDTADSGANALKSLAQTSYDLMILDIRMPEVDGIQVMARVHQQFPDLLVIVLTGFASLESAIAAVKAGAVDYLEKPASTHDIVQTVKTVLQRRASSIPVPGVAASQTGPETATDGVAANTLAVSPLTLIYTEQRVRLSEDPSKTVQLSPAEAEILFCLMQYPDQLQTYAQIVAHAWGQTMGTLEAQLLLRPHISRLRRKLRQLVPDHQVIQTVRTQGYRYVPQLSHE